MSITQFSIEDEQLETLQIGRRQLSTEWTDTVKPKLSGQNFCLILPFPETFQNAFECMNRGNYHARRAKGDRLQIFINGTEGDECLPDEVQEWLDLVGKYVAIKDLLPISFALDYTHEGSNPDRPRSAIAQLRARAKPYEGEATKLHKIAALELAAECVNFLEAMSCYHNVDCVVAVPPSDPEKAYSLPKVLSAAIAKARGIKDLSVFVSTKAKRASIKNKEAAEKLPTLRGTIEIKPDKFSGRTVLLIDDLYQSGTTMNYCAKLIHDAGAKSILGLACEKTCRNDDNV